MAETRRPLYRPLAATTLAVALAGCAATHVGDDWQCPLAQGAVCTSIAAADPAVAPERAPPALATETPLYRTPETGATVTEVEIGTKPGTETRPCAEGCNPFAWLGRLLAPRVDATEPVENDEVASTVPPEEMPAPAEAANADDAPCGSGKSAPEPVAAPVDTDDGAEPIDELSAPCVTAAEMQETTTPAAIEPIAPSTSAVIRCETDEAPATPAELPVEAAGTTSAPVAEDAERPCAAPASVDEIAHVAPGAPDGSVAVNAEPGEVEVTTAKNAATSTATANAPPSTPAPRLPPLSPAPDALRTGEVVGRIWIAPFVDAGGVYREGAWVRAVLAPAGWRRP